MHKNRKSPRWKEWDYSTPGIYFITICNKNREPYFGKIHHGKMNLSNIGIIADLLWNEIKNHHTNVVLDETVIMPDHIHGIIILNGTDSRRVGGRRDGACPIPTSDNIVTKYRRRIQIRRYQTRPPFGI